MSIPGINPNTSVLELKRPLSPSKAQCTENDQTQKVARVWQECQIDQIERTSPTPTLVSATNKINVPSAPKTAAEAVIDAYGYLSSDSAKKGNIEGAIQYAELSLKTKATTANSTYGSFYVKENEITLSFEKLGGKQGQYKCFHKGAVFSKSESGKLEFKETIGILKVKNPSQFDEELKKTHSTFYKDFQEGHLIDSPYVLKPLDVVRDDQGRITSIFVPYFAGDALSTDLVKSTAEVIHIGMLLQLAHGLKAIHDSGKVHRDLKRTNILVDHKRCEKTKLPYTLIVSDLDTITNQNDPKVDIQIGTMSHSPYECLDNIGLAAPARDIYSLGIEIAETFLSTTDGLEKLSDYFVYKSVRIHSLHEEKAATLQEALNWEQGWLKEKDILPPLSDYQEELLTLAQKMTVKDAELRPSIDTVITELEALRDKHFPIWTLL